MPTGGSRPEHEESLRTLGVAIRDRADDVASAVISSWRQRGSIPQPALHERVEEDIRRTVRLSTLALASYFCDGETQSDDLAHALVTTAKAPHRNTISLVDLTKLYLYWRDTTTVVLREEARRRGLDDEVTGAAVAIVRAASDASSVRMVTAFDVERQRLHPDLAKKQARLVHDAFHDSLTGVPNRRLFFDRLSHALELSARNKTAVALIFLDIDRFKSVNDDLGHSAGDEFLVCVARRLTRALRRSDTVARLGGDEFVIVCEQLVDPERETPMLIERLQRAFADPFTVGGMKFSASASIGAAIAWGESDPDDMLMRADRAMYDAKQRCRGGHQIVRCGTG